MERRRTIFIICITVVVLLLLGFGYFYHTVARFYVLTDARGDGLVALAIKSADPSICGKLVRLPVSLGDTTSMERSGCYVAYVMAHPEKDICPPTETPCLRTYALVADQPEICLKLQPKDQAQMPYCIFNVAAQYRSTSTCAYLQDTTERNQCLQIVTALLPSA